MGRGVRLCGGNADRRTRRAEVVTSGEIEERGFNVVVHRPVWALHGEVPIGPDDYSVSTVQVHISTAVIYSRELR